MKLEELLAEADEMLAAVEPITVPATLAKQTVGVRFMPVSGADWNALKAKFPPRPDVPADMNRGYNIDAVVGGYPDVALIIGNEVDDMVRTDDDGNRKSVWPETWARISASGRDDVAREMWAAHEYLPEMQVSGAGKALEG